MNITRALLSIVSVTVLTSGCISHSAPDFPKSWKPMNQLSDQIIEIPLIKPHSYEVTQLDFYYKALAMAKLDLDREEAKAALYRTKINKNFRSGPLLRLPRSTPRIPCPRHRTCGPET